MTTTEPSRKRKRVSKNKKKNWRKTDIAAVEEVLDNIRIQERTGGLAEEKSNEQLFFVDTAKNEISKEEPVPAKRNRREPKPLKCHAGLNPYPLIKPFRVVKNTRIESAKKLCATKRNKSTLSASEKKSLEHSQEAKTELIIRRKESRKLDKDTFNLWDGTDINSTPVELESYYAEKTRKTRIAVPITVKKKPSGLDHVEKPHPGQSYNPAYEDHQELLRDALTVEVKKAKAEAKIRRALDEAFPSRGKAPTEACYIQEMSAGLFEEADSDAEVTAQDLEAISVNPPVRRENKKTERQRKKQEGVKQKARTRQQQKEEKMFEKEVSRLKTLSTEVKKREADLAERKAKKEADKEANKDKTKKLGKLKYEEPEIPIKLSDELEGSLRLLKPEGHLLEDRWKSYQKRNIVEPRQRQKVVKKYKVKKFEKNLHKAVKL